jgi:hypothetical protein
MHVFFGIQDDGKSPEKFCEFCTTYHIVRILSSLIKIFDPWYIVRRQNLVSRIPRREEFVAPLVARCFGLTEEYVFLCENGCTSFIIDS